jgi:peptidoglycan/LPS O-acetylase OafA/YrhL
MQDEKQIKSLTALRGIAALAVLVCHLFPVFIGQDGVTPFFVKGYLAVDFFFMLSGFVLAHVYAAAFATDFSRQRFGAFLWARLARVYPVHLVTLVILMPAFGFSAQFSSHALLVNLALLQGPWLPYETWNNFSWSISAEWHAYLLFPFAAALIWRSEHWVTVAIVAACLVLICYALAVDGGSLAHVTNGPQSLARAVPEFIAGMLLYRMYAIPRLRAALVSDAAIVVPVVGMLVLAGIGTGDAPFLPLLLLLTLAGAANDGYARKTLASTPLQYLGRISYSVYMVQVACFYAVLSAQFILGLAHPTGAEKIALFISCLGLTVGVGALLSRYVEYPARALLRNRRTAASELVSPAPY